MDVQCLTWDRISTEELWTRLKLNGMRECLNDRRLQQCGFVGQMEESTWTDSWYLSHQ